MILIISLGITVGASANAEEVIEETDSVEEKTLDEYVYGDVQSFGDEEDK